MMEESLPRQHKRSFVFFLRISPSWWSCWFSSPLLSLGTSGLHCFAPPVLWLSRGAGKVLLIYFLPLSICISPLMSLAWVQSLQPEHLCYHLAPGPFPGSFPSSLLYPTLKVLGGFCPVACLVHEFPSKINKHFLLGEQGEAKAKS